MSGNNSLYLTNPEKCWYFSTFRDFSFIVKSISKLALRYDIIISNAREEAL